MPWLGVTKNLSLPIKTYLNATLIESMTTPRTQLKKKSRENTTAMQPDEFSKNLRALCLIDS